MKITGAKAGTKQVLTINGGSSSIKFALFETGEPLRRILAGQIRGIGQPQTLFEVKGASATDNFSKLVAVPDHAAAVNVLMDWGPGKGSTRRAGRGRPSRRAWRAKVLAAAADYAGADCGIA